MARRRAMGSVFNRGGSFPDPSQTGQSILDLDLAYVVTRTRPSDEFAEGVFNITPSASYLPPEHRQITFHRLLLSFAHSHARR